MVSDFLNSLRAGGQFGFEQRSAQDRENLMMQGDRVADMLRTAAQGIQPDLAAQLTAPMLARSAFYANMVNPKAGIAIDPFQDAVGTLDASVKRQTQMQDRQLGAETDLLTTFQKLKESGDKDAAVVYDTIGKITGNDPARMAKLLDELHQDPEEISAANIMTKALPAALRTGTIDPSYAISDQKELADLDLKKAQAEFYRNGKGGRGGTEFERLMQKSQEGSLTPQEAQRLNYLAQGGRDNFASTMQKESANAVVDARESAKKADVALKNLSLVKNQLSKAGPTGPIVDLTPKFIEGVLPGDATSREYVRSKLPELLQPFYEATKGAITDREVSLFATAVPSLDKREGANEKIISGMEASALRTKEYGKFIEEWARINGGNLNGSQEAWERFINENPLIDDDFNLNRANVSNWKKYLDNAPENAVPGSPSAQTAAPSSETPDQKLNRIMGF